MRLISALGTGLLIGTALIVIIPEGIETMYTASASSLPSPPPTQKGGLAALALHAFGGGQHQSSEEAGRAAEIAGFSRRTREVHEHGEDKTRHHAWIGVTLVTGFVLMYLIDTLSTSSSPSHGHHIPLTELDGRGEDPLMPSEPTSHSKSTTIGLIIHSLADGIALGASSAAPSTQSTLGIIVFAAILIHKAPAAFGLTAVLLKQGLGKRATRGHLLLFSLAAPFGAIVTWSLVNLMGDSRYAASAADSAWWTGLVLIFSGGTFL